MRLHKHQTTTTKTISSTTGTTTAIIIIVPLESSSLPDTSPGVLVLADDVGDVSMEVFKLMSDVAGLVDCVVRLDGVIRLDGVASSVVATGVTAICEIY